MSRIPRIQAHILCIYACAGVSKMQFSRTMVIICCFACTGCAALGRPDWTQPGPAKQQQRRAVRFDPYLQDDIAPSVLRMPLMDGARPRDFADPVPEITRSRWWAPVR